MFFPAPGGTLSDDVTCTDVCLFKAQEDMETMQAYAQVDIIKICSVNTANWAVKWKKKEKSKCPVQFSVLFQDK